MAGIAANGRIALAKLPQVNPDIVTLDIEMPELDGLGALRELRKTYPKLPVIMFSTLTERGAVATLDALSLGHRIMSPTGQCRSVTAGMETVKAQLLPKIKSLCPFIHSPPTTRSGPFPGEVSNNTFCKPAIATL